MKDFFHNRLEYWTFQEVVDFIYDNFEVTWSFSFRIWNKINTPEENQRAGLVLIYSKMMWYTFEQVKALFCEHDHFAIAMPETRIGRNIVEINNIYYDLIKNWHSRDIKIKDFPELIELPDNIIKK